MADFPINVSAGMVAAGDLSARHAVVARACRNPAGFVSAVERGTARCGDGRCRRPSARVLARGRRHAARRESAAQRSRTSDRWRPTLALLPRGNWLRYSWYDHPALLAGGIDRLIEYALGRFAAELPTAPAAGLEMDRFILTAHSGGGMPAVDVIDGSRQPPDELHVFDGLYGRDPATGDPMRGLETIDRWLGERLAREPGRKGALRVVYIEQQTGPFSRRVGALISQHLAAAEAVLAANLSRRYRVEPSAVQHAQIAQRCGPDLLAAADAEFDWSR